MVTYLFIYLHPLVSPSPIRYRSRRITVTISWPASSRGASVAQRPTCRVFVRESPSLCRGSWRTSMLWTHSHLYRRISIRVVGGVKLDNRSSSSRVNIIYKISLHLYIYRSSSSADRVCKSFYGEECLSVLLGNQSSIIL